MNRKAVLGIFCLFLFALLLFSFTDFTQATYSNIKLENSDTQSVKPGLDFNVTNVTLTNSLINNKLIMLNISFDIMNPFDQKVVIYSPDTCTPFTSYVYVFPVNDSPYGLKSWFPYICGQFITYLNINPGISHHSSEFYFNDSIFPNGDLFLQPILRGFISNPLNTPFYTSTMQVTIENNSIISMKNYVSNPALYQQAYVLIRSMYLVKSSKFVPPIYQNSSNYLEFNVAFDILTLNGQDIYPRSLNESLYFNLELENLDMHTFGPFVANYSLQWSVSRFGIPARYTGLYDFDLNTTINNSYNTSFIPNGNYSIHLVEQNDLIMDNNSNYVIFKLMNDQISDVQFSNLSISLPPEQLTNSEPRSTNPTSLTTDSSSLTNQVTTTSESSFLADSTAKPSSNPTGDGFTALIPIIVICFIFINRKKRF